MGPSLPYDIRIKSFLKEQYPVTAHAPNFDFWTGCREIKRCEESKRTLKNPFASRLTEFNTRGGTLGISGWGCATGTLEPLTYTRASSAEFCYPVLE